MNKYALFSILTLIAATILAPHSHAQQTSFDLKKASNQYNASGTISISRNGSQYTYSAVVKDLPATPPASGTYYILWGLNTQGKADNLGPISNSTENRGTLSTRITQFFITSERERVPEFVNGPRVAQTDTIPESAFTGIASPSPSPLASPGKTLSPIPTAVPIGGPTGAPETGLGGSLLINGLIYSLGGIGFTGVGLSLYNKFRKR